MAGRKKEESACRRHIISFRLSDDELARIEDQAQAAGLSARAYIRQSALKKRTPIKQNPGGFAFETIYELRRIGAALFNVLSGAQLYGHPVPDELILICRQIETLLDREEAAHGSENSR